MPVLFACAAYGSAFALSSLGCTLPLFLTAVGTGMARGGTGVVWANWCCTHSEWAPWYRS
jgi:hypothetical protein